MSDKQVLVSLALGPETHLVGRLWHRMRKGRESASFEYDETWLRNKERFALEPALGLVGAAFHTAPDQIMFGAFDDTAPDRWGRVLMRRSQRQGAKGRNEQLRSLNELDYILGVNDEARQGALRFSETKEGLFLTPTTKTSIPPLVELPRLLQATERFIEDNETAEDLRLLLAPGSSLGGARPKASVRDQDGSLSIAKFPRKDDEANVVAWEAVTLSLAKKVGIRVPSWRLETIADKPVLIIKRFDRTPEGRVPFLSAMSMIGARDNQQRSYIELAYALAQNGASPSEDMEELWRRIVFSILVSNTDDHMRNHGFIYERYKGWRLSPAYDINPTPIDLKPRILSTAIDFDDGTASLDLALSVIDEFRISSKRAKEVIREVGQVTGRWEEEARKHGLPTREVDRMSSAFEHDDLNKATKL
jgi:serine/threonine-protein kinase HipA